jgi:dipeptidyl aminopeptidase/acylaminoacyl peptidase
MKKLHFKIIGMLMMTLSSQAQPKNKIRTEDYNKWGELKDEKMASDSRWISYKMDYAVGTDTLFLQNVTTGGIQKFPNGNSAEFTADSNWFLFADGNYLSVLNLKDHTNDRIQNVKKYAYNKATGTLVILKADDSRLLLYKSNGQKNREIPNTKDFAFSSRGVLALMTDKGIAILKHPNDATTIILKDNESEFSRLSWDDSGKILVFFKTASNTKTTAVCYHLNTEKIQFLEEEVMEQRKVVLQSSRPISLSPATDRIFLYTKSTEKPMLVDDALVEVWDAATSLHYPEQRELEKKPYAPQLQIWDLKDNYLKKIVSDSLQDMKLLPNRKYALLYNQNKTGHLHLENPVADYYLVNLQTGTTQLCLKSQSTASGLLMPSPIDSYIGYYNDSGWNIYNYETNVNNLIFDKAWIEKKEENEKYKSTSPGWTEDGKYMILYIGLDIWFISPDGKEKKRITNGKETGIKFRPVTEIYNPDRQVLNEEIRAKSFKLPEGLLLHGFFPDKTTSIYKWTPTNGLILLHKSKGKVSLRSKSANGNSILLEEQTTTTPPSLWILDCHTKKAVLQYQSNSQYKKQEQPRTKLLSYKNDKGKELNAILHYPVGYDESKKYPMIVYVYELLSQNLYTYNNPSMYDAAGFALANYTNEGYFVLMPDITYTIGDPGTSATDCVLKAVNTALLSANIDKKRMGLIGHSYGGHETSLIITKTPIFAAAVAGAASTNMISDYLSLNEVTQVNKFWKFEVHQYRMGFPPFDNWQAYIKNSPVMNAEKIETPLLSWTGKSDGTVDWRQSVELHLALKRLKKTNTLLVYPNERHILNNLEAQLDLTLRIKKWFDQYLK